MATGGERDRTLFRERGVEVTYRRFVEPGGQEYRTADILAVDLQVVEEQADRQPIRWWYTVGGGAIVGGAVAAIGDFEGQWLTGGILVLLMSVALTWYFNRIRSGKFKVYHIIVTLPTARADRQEHRIISSTSRFFSERLKAALERAMRHQQQRKEPEQKESEPQEQGRVSG